MQKTLEQLLFESSKYGSAGFGSPTVADCAFRAEAMYGNLTHPLWAAPFTVNYKWMKLLPAIKYHIGCNLTVFRLCFNLILISFQFQFNLANLEVHLCVKTD